MTTVTTATESSLTISDLTFGYSASEPVIRGMNAVLTKGRLCALIGPNAAGKTTLLRLMLGQLDPYQGQVVMDGRDVRELSAGDRAAWMSYVPQRAGVSFGFTVEQVVEMGRYALTRSPQAVDEAIERTDLSSLRRRIYRELSIGQQQRVLLARAIAQAAGRGRYMLLDEPGSAMDMWHVHQTMRTLTRLRDAGVSVLVVVHDLNLAARYADEVWLMQDGRLAASGVWRDVLVPEILQPVYRMSLTPLYVDGSDRPLFRAEPSDTL